MAIAELETRRALEAKFISACDSLIQAGLEWDQVRIRLERLATSEPMVKAVRKDGPTFQVVWGSGYRYFEITKDVRIIRMGGRGSFEQNEEMIAKRLDYVRSLLDDGGVLFLLGGGAEYYIDQRHRESVLDAVENMLAGGRSGNEDLGALPPEVRTQLRKPLALERVR
jgi:hypothetical protein